MTAKKSAQPIGGHSTLQKWNAFARFMDLVLVFVFGYLAMNSGWWVWWLCAAFCAFTAATAPLEKLFPKVTRRLLKIK